MKIGDIGEFALIKRITRKPKDKSIIQSIGDDAAIVKVGNKYLVLTTDSLVEGDHFSLDYFTPEQVGKKAIEVNVSDVGAVGGIPRYALASLILRKDLQLKVFDGVFRGMWKACRKYGIEIIGGNMAHGDKLVVDIMMVGFVRKKDIKLRSHAKPGDFIFVTGELGASTAGLKLFLAGKKGFSYVKKKHLEPEAKFYKVRKFLRYINAMIDVSDGLASEVARICEQSNAGAVIYADNVPLKDKTREAAKAVGKDVLDYALYGGEDFEMVFTVSEKNINKVRGYLVGEIRKKKGVYLYRSGKETPIKRHGYDHFLV